MSKKIDDSVSDIIAKHFKEYAKQVIAGHSYPRVVRRTICTVKLDNPKVEGVKYNGKR